MCRLDNLVKARKTKADMVAAGRVFGAPAYGWKSEDGVLIPDETEQKVVALALDMRARHRTYSTIARVLNARGITTRRGTPWCSDSIRKTIKRKEAGWKSK
jgi:hypothetical protein